jgi:hypothetical protein
VGARGTYIDGDEMDLGVTVLAGLGGGHVDDLAGTACAAGGGRHQHRRWEGTDGQDNAPLMTTWPFLRRAEHCMGKVKDAPEPACDGEMGVSAVS